MGKRPKSPEYNAWAAMRARCSNPRKDHCGAYLARGIKVCARWAASFQAFLADVGPRPSPQHSLDRIDNDGHYEPGNVRWATRTQQARNRRSSRRLTWRGETLTVAEWAERLGLPYNALGQRLFHGWPVERALSTPVAVRR